jgi:hypothetical protein
MDNVWLVFWGFGDSHTVVAVCASRDVAERFIPTHSAANGNPLDEYWIVERPLLTAWEG